MNQIYLGQRAYGFEAAAQAYFGKSLKDLSTAETAMLAGLPQNPYYANPIMNLPRAQRRQAVVLQRMVDVGMITPSRRSTRATSRSSCAPRRTSACPTASTRRRWSARWCTRTYGDEAYSRGLRVTTTLRMDDQVAA